MTIMTVRICAHIFSRKDMNYFILLYNIYIIYIICIYLRLFTHTYRPISDTVICQNCQTFVSPPTIKKQTARLLPAHPSLLTSQRPSAYFPTTARLLPTARPLTTGKPRYLMAFSDASIFSNAGFIFASSAYFFIPALCALAVTHMAAKATNINNFFVIPLVYL